MPRGRPTPERADPAPPAEKWRHELRVAIGLARWAGARMRADATQRRTGAGQASDRSKANPADLVTATDQAIEIQVRRTLDRHFPRHGVLGEELGRRPGEVDAPVWLVDPVDGTTNFSNGVGWSCFSLGLVDDAGPLLAVVADPWRREVYSAVRGRGATCNGRALSARSVPGLAGQLVMTEWAGHEPWPGMSEVLASLAGRYCTTRIMGSTALSIVQVAAGRAAGALVGAYHPLDGLPAALIALEAAAVVVELDGRPTLADAGGLEAASTAPAGAVLVSAPAVKDELLELWRSARPTV